MTQVHTKLGQQFAAGVSTEALVGEVLAAT
jgi:hypothetical protein